MQENYLQRILELYDTGIVTNDASKKIKEDIEKETDSLKVYQSVRNNISDTYITNSKQNKKINDSISEIILSEFLIGENNG